MADASRQHDHDMLEMKGASRLGLARRASRAPQQHALTSACAEYKRKTQGMIQRAEEEQRMSERLATAQRSEQEALSKDVSALSTEEGQLHERQLAMSATLDRLRQELSAAQAQLGGAVQSAAMREREMSQAVGLFQQWLGLEFESIRGTQGALNLAFTRIDSAQPGRRFIFGLCVDGDNQYRALYSEPGLPAAQIETLIQTLNASQNLGKFCKALRELFKLAAARE
jgi:hypothetical protein